MKRIVRPGGTVGFYVWDYPGGGIEFGIGLDASFSAGLGEDLFERMVVDAHDHTAAAA